MRTIISTKELIQEISSLPVDERAVVLDSILRSLNPPDKVIDRKWAAVAKRRLAEIQSGQVTAIPGPQVFNKIWKRYSK